MKVETLFLEGSEAAQMVGNSPRGGKPSLHSLYMREKYTKCAIHRQLEKEWEASHHSTVFEFMLAVSESKYLDVG